VRSIKFSTEFLTEKGVNGREVSVEAAGIKLGFDATIRVEMVVCGVGVESKRVGGMLG